MRQLRDLRERDLTEVMLRARAWVAESHSLESYAERWNTLLDTIQAPRGVAASA